MTTPAEGPERDAWLRQRGREEGRLDALHLMHIARSAGMPLALAEEALRAGTSLAAFHEQMRGAATAGLASAAQPTATFDDARAAAVAAGRLPS